MYPLSMCWYLGELLSQLRSAKISQHKAVSVYKEAISWNALPHSKQERCQTVVCKIHRNERHLNEVKREVERVVTHCSSLGQCHLEVSRASPVR